MYLELAEYTENLCQIHGEAVRRLFSEIYRNSLFGFYPAPVLFLFKNLITQRRV
jgi:hypothetical protein